MADGSLRRVVLDTAVLVSGAISSAGPSARLLDFARSGRLEVLICPMLIRELRATMAKPRLQRWLSGPDEVAAYVADVSRWATHLPDPIDIDFTACRDPNDAFILAFGLQTEADAIVSGDKDLTVLVRHRPSVLTPRRALDRLDD